jgi:hypothetical protein
VGVGVVCADVHAVHVNSLQNQTTHVLASHIKC